MIRQLLRRPAVGGGLHQIGGRHHFNAQATHQLHCAGVHARHAGQFVLRGVLHRQTPGTGDQPAQGRHHRIAAAVYDALHPRIGELAGVHMMRQQRRRPGGGQVKVAGPRDMTRRADHLPENGVGFPVVVHQPARGAILRHKFLRRAVNLLKSRFLNVHNRPSRIVLSDD